MTNFAVAVLARGEVDRVVFLALLGRAWQLVAGPVTLLMIAHYFTAEVQGFYYTFSSLLALQSFVELGLYLVIISVSSHEWARLELDEKGRIVGDRAALSRLVSLGRLVFRWYTAAGVVFVLGVSTIGYILFSRTEYRQIEWQAPWITLVVLAGLLLWALPFSSLLEGCNQMHAINRFRVEEAVLSSLSFWLFVHLGGGLWAPVAMAMAKVLWMLYLLVGRYRRFFQPFFAAPADKAIDWRIEVWPMQWRLALSGMVNYLAFSLFNPVMFYYHGAAVAGRMGMTWQIVGALQTLAMAWVAPRAPQFGMLVARRDYFTLDRLWFRTSVVSLVVMTTGAVALWGLVYSLRAVEVPFAQRLLGPWPTAVLLLAAILMQVSQCQTAYMRAHKQELIVVLSVTSSLATGLLVWLLGRRFGPIGAVAGYLGVAAWIVVWETAIWRHFRAKVMVPASGDRA